MFHDELEVMEQLTGRDSEALEDGSFSRSLSIDNVEKPQDVPNNDKRERPRKKSRHAQKKMLRINLAKVQVATDDLGTQTPDENASNGGRAMTEPSPYLDKGKQRLIDTSISVDHDDDIRLAQIRADSRMARILQEELNKIYTERATDYNTAGPSGHRSDPPLRASSQMPKGSHVHRILSEERAYESRPTGSCIPKSTFLPGDSSGDSSPPSSPTSDDGADWSSLSSEPSEPVSDLSACSKRRYRARKRHWKKKMLKLKMEQANAKPDPPFVYNGEPNFMMYQKWVLEAKDWLKHSFIQRKHHVTRLKKYLSGCAFLFFMRDVAHEPKKWSLARVLEGLFDHCFPMNFQMLQCEKYLAFMQCSHPVQNYCRDLEELVNSVGNITSRDLTIRFWQGADRYLRVKWAENGYDPEELTLAELEGSAERYERAAKLRQSEDGRTNEQTYRSNNHQDSRPSQHHPVTQDVKSSHSHSATASVTAQPTHQNNGNSNRSRTRASNNPHRCQLSQEQKAEYRAQGKCFECGNVGHLIKDCPKRNRT